jgi:hypothetical protein
VKLLKFGFPPVPRREQHFRFCGMTLQWFAGACEIANVVISWTRVRFPPPRSIIEGRRWRHRCIPGDIVKTTKPLFFLDENADFVAVCARCEMQARSSREVKPFEFVDVLYDLLKSMRYRVAIRCHFLRPHVAKNGPRRLANFAINPWTERTISRLQARVDPRRRRVATRRIERDKIAKVAQNGALRLANFATNRWTERTIGHFCASSSRCRSKTRRDHRQNRIASRSQARARFCTICACEK